MKKNLSLIAFCVLLTSHANAALQELWLDGVSFKGGWYDINKTWNGDGKLCWAAAASNIINWWQDRYVLPPGTPTGSAVWSTFKNSFENEGSSPQYAMEWWLSKTYRPQGDSTYDDYAQNTNASTGGYYQSVFNAAQAAGLVSSYEKSGGYSEEILNRLNAGYGLTLSIASISKDDGTKNGTRHAITLWGVEYDDVTSQLTKMYVTDSDDTRDINFNPGGIFEMTCYTKDGDNRLFFETEATWEEVGLGMYKNNSSEYYVDGVYGLSTNVEGFLQMIPEPGTATLGLAALLCLAWRRRRLESC